jgi:hypothetical protein
MRMIVRTTAIAFLCAAVLGSARLHAQAPVTVFRGTPQIRINEGGTSRVPENLARPEAVNLAVVISKIGETFYWASRENIPLVEVSGGAFVTYVAVNGSGYIRVVKPEFKKAASLLGEAEERFDYVEHLLVGLHSVTYYGAGTSGR